MTERELDDWLRRAAARRRAVAEVALADLDLTPAQFSVLDVVYAHPGVSAAEIARIERLTPPTVSVIVGNLIRKSALARRAHPDNARIGQLTLTDFGARLFREGGAKIDAGQRQLRTTLPPGAADQMTRWLRAVAEHGP